MNMKPIHDPSRFIHVKAKELDPSKCNCRPISPAGGGLSGKKKYKVARLKGQCGLWSIPSARLLDHLVWAFEDALHVARNNADIYLTPAAHVIQDAGCNRISHHSLPFLHLHPTGSPILQNMEIIIKREDGAIWKAEKGRVAAREPNME